MKHILVIKLLFGKTNSDIYEGHFDLEAVFGETNSDNNEAHVGGKTVFVETDFAHE